MSASQGPAFDAIAFQVVAALEQYERDAAAMLAQWPDLERYREVSDGIERVRLYTSSLPEARVHWVELLIAHAELVHCLWREQYGHDATPQQRAELAAVRERHVDCVAALRKRCLRIARSRPDALRSA